MLCLYPDPAVLSAARGRFVYTENGRPCGRVFAPDALVGISLTLPRSLGVTAAALTLTPAGGGETLSFPLSPTPAGPGEDTYGTLLWGSELAPHAALWLGSVCLVGAFGVLYTRPFGGDVAFSHDPLPGVPLVFSGACGYIPPGSLYAVPLDRLLGMDGAAYPAFFSHLSSLGVCGLYLCPPVGEGACGIGQGPSACPPPACYTAACAAGIRLLADFGSLIAWDTEGPTPASLAAAFVPGGVVDTARAAGYSGFLLRGADGYSDSFISTLRTHLPQPWLLGGTQETAAPGGPFPRHFFFGGELDAPVNTLLRSALLSYFLEGDTAPLAAYFGEYLPALPPGVLSAMPNLLATHETLPFFLSLTEEYDGETAGAICDLAVLVAATLPGVPMYMAGEEAGRAPDGEVLDENGEARLAFVRRTVKLRKNAPLYRDAPLRLLHLSTGTLVFARDGEGESYLTVINAGNTPLRLASAGYFYAVLGGRGRKTDFLLPPYTGMVVRVPYDPGEAPTLTFAR